MHELSQAGRVPAGHGIWNGRDLDELLTVNPVSDWAFRSLCSEENGNAKVFGGQFLGQALDAASRTVGPAMYPSALNVLFMQGAEPAQPIHYAVTALQDGKRFGSRHVRGSQNGRLLIDANATFKHAVDGPEHALPPPEGIPDPEALRPHADIATQAGPALAGEHLVRLAKPHLDMRVIGFEQIMVAANPAPRLTYWLRLRHALADQPRAHASALAYLSDYWLNSAATTHHVPARDGFSSLYVASLNHSLWFHRPCRADDWLLFHAESPHAGDGRALTIARVFNRAREHIATVAQECLLTAR